MPFTTAAAVAAHLGRTFTAAQAAEAETLLPAADAWINGRTGRSWPQATAITDELHTLVGPSLFLDFAPVASVASVAVRPPQVGASWTALTAGSGYEVLDLATGHLHVPHYPGYWVRVSYTPAVPTDARIELAAKKLVAFWLRPVLDGVSGDVQSYAIGQELEVTFSKEGQALGIPPDVIALVDSINTEGLVFA